MGDYYPRTPLRLVSVVPALSFARGADALCDPTGGSSGEAVKIFVVKKDPSLTEEALVTFCRRQLTGYKVPKLVEFRDELPKSNVGKILRRELRDEARGKVDNKA